MNTTGQMEAPLFVDTLKHLCSTRKNGVLTVRYSQDTAKIFIQEGQIIGATMPGMVNLGDFLILNKGVKFEAIVQAVARQRVMEIRKPLGAILVERGFISSEMLRDAILFQIQSVVSRLVALQESEFDFKAQENPTLDDIFVTFEELVFSVSP